MAVSGKAVKTTIPNPLYSYRFSPNPGDMGGSPVRPFSRHYRINKLTIGSMINGNKR